MAEPGIDLKKPYTAWLEETVRQVYELDLQNIAIAGRTQDGCIFTGYFRVDFQEMGFIADAIRDDRTLMLIQSNIREIKDALEELEEQEDG